MCSKEQGLKWKKKKTEKAQRTLLSVQSLKSHGLFINAGSRKVVSSSRHSVKVQWWQTILTSSWVWNLSTERFLHSPISGNSKQGSVADPLSAGLECWSSYRERPQVRSGQSSMWWKLVRYGGHSGNLFPFGSLIWKHTEMLHKIEA
jgi:hypothetical protein